MASPSTERPCGDRRQWLVPAALGCVALAVRLVLLRRYQPWLTPNDFEFGEIARNILAGRGYSGRFAFFPYGPTAEAYPLYVYFLVGWYSIFEVPARYIAVMLAQTVMSAAVVPLAWWVARRLFDRSVAVLAAGVVALDYFLGITPGFLSHTTLDILTLSLGIAAVVHLRDKPSTARAIVCGIVIGLAALTKAFSLVVLPVASVWLLLRARTGRGRRVALVAVVWAGAVLTLMPWTVRNCLVFGRFVPLATNGGVHLWVGNNPHATGGSYARDGRPVTDYAPDHIRAEIKGGSEPEISGVFAREAFRWMRRNPGRFLILRARALFYIFFNQDYWMDPAVFPYNPVLKWLTVAMMAAALAGMVVSWRRWPDSRLLVGVIAFYGLACSLFHADISNRFRLPLEPFLLMFAAGLVTVCLRFVGNRRKSHDGGRDLNF